MIAVPLSSQFVEKSPRVAIGQYVDPYGVSHIGRP